MGTLGCGLSLVAAVFAVVGLVPFLGWLNWITTLPLALLAIAFSGLALSKGTLDRAAAAAGLVGGVLLTFWALFRLTIGGGVI
ncbi:MAG: hypothetical protein M3462_11755 [Chloroflexota bacterium]|nr:hypothetical protein [Chloroflexota bacterium]